MPAAAGVAAVVAGPIQAADTWGIPSQAFLAVYLIGWALLITTYVVRWRAVRLSLIHI